MNYFFLTFSIDLPPKYAPITVIRTSWSRSVHFSSTVNVNAPASIKINKGAKHRILNPGDTILVFIEVQTGTYFGEDDIVRIEDDYNRVD